MVLVSITRLRILSIRSLPAFALHTYRSLRQTWASGGFIGGALLADRRRTFWTMTLWRDEAAMKRFMASGAHLKAMPKLLDWCDEASVVRWTQMDATLPCWEEADRRMRDEGRPSKVRRPSPNHADLSYAAPRTSGSLPIAPIRQRAAIG